MTINSFIHQKAYEHIDQKIRRDAITTIPVIVLFLFLFTVPLVVYWFINTNFPNMLEQSGLQNVSVFLLSIYYLAIGLFFYTYFVTYYLDILVLTNDRLLHIEQEGIFARTISEVDLFKIQDITSTIDGFFPSLFNYGDLLIQTAGALEKFAIESVPQPEKLRQKILDLAEEDRKFHNASATTVATVQQ